MLRNVKLILI